MKARKAFRFQPIPIGTAAAVRPAEGGTMSREHATHLTHERDLRFRIRFSDPRTPELVSDYRTPPGEGAGPDPIDLLAASVGSCMALTLMTCTRKAHLELAGLEAQVEVETVSIGPGRSRIEALHVRLEPAADSDTLRRMDRCVEIFESFCTVAHSLRRGIDVRVEVAPRTVAEHDTRNGRQPLSQS